MRPAAGIVIYNHKIAKHTNADDSDEAVFRDQDILFNEHENPVFSDQDIFNEVENPVADESPRGSQQLALNKFKNPAADESQESHSPSPSFCLSNTMALCRWLATGSGRFNDMPWLELLRLRKAFQQ